MHLVDRIALCAVVAQPTAYGSLCSSVGSPSKGAVAFIQQEAAILAIVSSAFTPLHFRNAGVPSLRTWAGRKIKIILCQQLPLPLFP